MSDVRLVCFDWGGVILRICRTWDEALGQAGLDKRIDPDDPAIVERRRPISLAYQTGRIACADFFASLSDAVGAAYTPEELRRLHDAYLIEEYPGVRPLIDRVHRAGRVETGLLSNTNHRHWVRHLDDERPADFPTVGLLGHRHASHLLGVAKPEEAIFRRFEAESGFGPESILLFDDLEDNVAAARRAGWRAERIDHAGDTAAQMERVLGRFRLL